MEPVPVQPEEINYFKENTEGYKDVEKHHDLSTNLSEVTEGWRSKGIVDIRNKYDNMVKDLSSVENRVKGHAMMFGIDKTEDLAKIARIKAVAENIRDNFDKGKPEEEDFTPTGKNQEEEKGGETEDFIDGREQFKNQIRKHDLYKAFYRVCEKSGMKEETADKVAGTMFLSTGYAMLGSVGVLAIGVLSSLVAIPVLANKAKIKAKMQMDQEIRENPSKKKSIEKKYSKILNHK